MELEGNLRVLVFHEETGGTYEGMLTRLGGYEVARAEGAGDAARMLIEAYVVGKPFDVVLTKNDERIMQEIREIKPSRQPLVLNTPSNYS